MKRLLSYSIALTALLTYLPQWGQFTAVSGQDITITVRQEDKPSKPPFRGHRPAVDVAILLDTSNSMDGLISQAKSQLWNIIQEFAKAEKSGKTPELRVSVFEYGNTKLPASEGYVRQVCQLTDDLDKVSESLFSLKTDGGDEYCGTVINEAIKRLDWSEQPNAYKAIFIAGNEPFNQGSLDYKKACVSAIDAGIVVNTIHCGDYQKGVSGKWKHGADLAEGKYMNIDQDRAVVHIKAPQDKIIIELNNELNKTYLWYGRKSVRLGFSANQALQDKNSYGYGGGAGRASTKAGALYRNEGRDLIDSYASDKALLSKLKDSTLPDEMQRMTQEERKAHVEKMTKQRAAIKKKMLEAAKSREAFVANARRDKAAAAGEKASTLGDAVTEAVREQLKSSGFDLKKE